MNGQQIDLDLIEQAWRGEPPRCEAKVYPVPGDAPGHACTSIARWACNNGHGRLILWCDGRYKRHLETITDRWNCALCKTSVTHWTVTAL